MEGGEVDSEWMTRLDSGREWQAGSANGVASKEGISELKTFVEGCETWMDAVSRWEVYDSPLGSIRMTSGRDECE